MTNFQVHELSAQEELDGTELFMCEIDPEGAGQDLKKITSRNLLKQTYGHIYGHEIVGHSLVLSASTWTATDAFAQDGETRSLTASASTNLLQPDNKGVYLIRWSCTFTGGAGIIYRMAPFYSGVQVQAAQAENSIEFGSYCHMSGAGLYDITSAGSAINLRVWAGSATTISIKSVSLLATLAKPQV